MTPEKNNKKNFRARHFCSDTPAPTAPLLFPKKGRGKDQQPDRPSRA